MGLCFSGLSSEQKRQKQLEYEKNCLIDENNRKACLQDEKIFKLLLLGSGESGKSTLFKQMVQLYGQGYSTDERIAYRDVLLINALSSMKTLCQHVDLYSSGVLPSTENSKAFVLSCSMEHLEPEVPNHIQTLWSDSAIQLTFANRASFQLVDNADYFFNRIHTLADPDYLPSDQDILRCRVRTTGIVETTFKVKSHVFRILDVGGQRNERKKWVHCFEGITAVIFVVALSEFDQKLYEDQGTNRMQEALHLFSSVCNIRWFQTSSMILFLNKTDLFEKKIANVDLNVCFEDYTGGKNYEAARSYVQDAFLKQNTTNKSIYCHSTCATDTDNVNAVFTDVCDILIYQSLNQAGLL